MATPPPNTSNSGTSIGPPRGSNTAANQGSGTRIDISPSDPPGRISFIAPPQHSISIFKIASGLPITFAWNATGIKATPTSLTIAAVDESGFTYPVGPSDGKIPGGATSVVWDVYSYQHAHQSPTLREAMYTLQVSDDRGLGVAPKAGYLMPNQELRFGLYTPRPYTALASGWSCTVCENGALSNSVGNPLFISVLVTTLVMFLSGFSLIQQRR
ncbi:hypothetical protein L218DRAFT_433525 [Marasmius fiardii PR-910]|nr:hypothetical protein L218DRAFT_433525 [Marasmius fiardii PR-910]